MSESSSLSGNHIAALLATTSAGCFALGYLLGRKSASAPPKMEFDHVVMNCIASHELLEKTTEFWRDGVGLEMERTEEYKAYQALYEKRRAEKLRTEGTDVLESADYAAITKVTPLAFPSARVNEGMIIDLFPVELEAFQCPNNRARQQIDEGTAPLDEGTPSNAFKQRKQGNDHSGPGKIDHFCINMEFDILVAALPRLKKLGHPVIQHGTRYGARGQGYSIYFHDPQGFWVELRHYDLSRTVETAKIAAKYMA